MIFVADIDISGRSNQPPLLFVVSASPAHALIAFLILCFFKRDHPPIRCKFHRNTQKRNNEKIHMEAGIMLSLNNTFGVPSETEEDLWMGVDVYRKHAGSIKKTARGINRVK